MDRKEILANNETDRKYLVIKERIKLLEKEIKLLCKNKKLSK